MNKCPTCGTEMDIGETHTDMRGCLRAITERIDKLFEQLGVSSKENSPTE